MLKYIIILLIQFQVCFSQNIKISYKCEKKGTNYTKNDVGYLFIENNLKSSFHTQVFFERDSITNSAKNKSDFNVYDEVDKLSKISSNTFLTEYVLKDKVSKTIKTLVKLGMEDYVLHQSADFVWELLDAEVEIFNSFKCSKAVTTYAGRKYIALYTDEIPISDGPFKFSGLPGLILKITDSDGIFNFEMIGIEKQTNFKKFVQWKYNDLEKVSFKQYLNVRSQYDENPLKQFTDLGFTVSNVDPDILNRKITQNKRVYIEVNE